MFKLERPSMAVNDPRVSAGKHLRRFRLWNTWDISEHESRAHIIEWVEHVARTAPGGKLKHLVLSCHGLPGYLQLGEGFNRDHLKLFDAWKGRIEKLWLPNCLVAQIPSKEQMKEYSAHYPGWGVSDGNLFCSELAKRIQCYVVAATEIQAETFSDIPPDSMTSFEGLVLSYGPAGNITWQGRNASIWYDRGQIVKVAD